MSKNRVKTVKKIEKIVKNVEKPRKDCQIDEYTG